MSVRHGEAAGKNRKPSPEYSVWGSMLSRCNNPTVRGYADYGGRGIRVATSWLIYENFLADMGRRPSPLHSLDRIDTNAGYCAGNVRWATRREQQRNKRTNRNVTVNGVSRLLCEWAELTGIPLRIIWERIDTGWTAEAAVYTPVRQGRPKFCQNGHDLAVTARWEGQSRRCRKCKETYDRRRLQQMKERGLVPEGLAQEEGEE